MTWDWTPTHIQVYLVHSRPEMGTRMNQKIMIQNQNRRGNQYQFSTILVLCVQQNCLGFYSATRLKRTYKLRCVWFNKKVTTMSSFPYMYNGSLNSLFILWSIPPRWHCSHICFYHTEFLQISFTFEVCILCCFVYNLMAKVKHKM